MEERFIDNGDGTVTDRKTHLMWMQNDSYNVFKRFLVYSVAKKFLAKMNDESFAGHNDWRIPSKEEAHSLYYRDKEKSIQDKYEMDLYIDPVFTEGGGYDTWTSNTRGKITAYVFSFGSGTGGHKEVDDTLDTSVRLVRGTMDEKVKAVLGKIPPKKGMVVTDQR
ncbi:MAG: DUF1566 domain-containing protein [Nitrospinota bacterium]|nr:DUF1566 domain-containing protein [Nitrospinota bacterium]